MDNQAEPKSWEGQVLKKLDQTGATEVPLVVKARAGIKRSGQGKLRLTKEVVGTQICQGGRSGRRQNSSAFRTRVKAVVIASLKHPIL